MEAADLRDLLEIAPFRPITLDIGRGRTAVIEDPDLTLLSKDQVVFAAKTHKGIVEGLQTVNLSQAKIVDAAQEK